MSDRSQTGVSGEDAPRVTHIIPAHNESRFLPKTLGSVRAAISRSPVSVEIVVVDNVSTDGTAEVARAHGARVVLETTRCIAAVRNAGARAARGAYLSFADADSLVSANFFERVVANLDREECGGGNFAIRPDRTSVGIRFNVQLVIALVRLIYRVGGGSYFCRKADFEAIGGFDTGRQYGEDVDFACRLKRHAKRRGMRYVQDHTAEVITSMRKAEVFGDWHPILFLLKLPLYAFRPSAAYRYLRGYFYEFDRTAVGPEDERGSGRGSVGEGGPRH